MTDKKNGVIRDHPKALQPYLKMILACRSVNQAGNFCDLKRSYFREDSRLLAHPSTYFVPSLPGSRPSLKLEKQGFRLAFARHISMTSVVTLTDAILPQKMITCKLSPATDTHRKPRAHDVAHTSGHEKYEALQTLRDLALLEESRSTDHSTDPTRAATRSSTGGCVAYNFCSELPIPACGPKGLAMKRCAVAFVA